MSEKGTLNSFNLLCLWFGAAVSVAEIFTGGWLATDAGLGLGPGLWAIVLGHVVGTSLLALGGIIGFNERLPSIMSTRISFGKQGSYLISVINVLQLIGWTAVMVLMGSSALTQITETLWDYSNPVLMAAILGAFIALWVGIGLHGFKYLNVVAVLLLFGLTIVLSAVVVGNPAPETTGSDSGSFALGFELSIIMPLSWFPLIADYTSQ
ncbi:MAG: putative hydroxymethylpyrimidine transporter CytX, partial [Desulfovibrio sp.]